MIAKYIGCDDSQVAWGNNNDPRGLLEVGVEYEVEKKEIHSWHTKIKLAGIDGMFNSVCFEIVGEIE